MDAPFDVLGIERGADEATVDKAYRRRVKESHPDQGGSAEEFQRVREAYEAIKSGRGNDAIETGEVDVGGDANGHPATGTPGDTGRSGGTANERGPGSRAPGGASAASSNGRNSSDGTDAAGPTNDPETATVEYLDYEALTQEGWDLGDEDLFEKAAASGLEREDYGTITVRRDRPLLETAEAAGLSWPYACRGSACANCAVAVVEGDMSMPGDHVLSESMVERGIRLSCASEPTTDELQVVVNVKHLPGLDELRLPADRFEGSF